MAPSSPSSSAFPTVPAHRNFTTLLTSYPQRSQYRQCPGTHVAESSLRVQGFSRSFRSRAPLAHSLTVAPAQECVIPEGAKDAAKDWKGCQHGRAENSLHVERPQPPEWSEVHRTVYSLCRGSRLILTHRNTATKRAFESGPAHSMKHLSRHAPPIIMYWMWSFVCFFSIRHWAVLAVLGTSCRQNAVQRFPQHVQGEKKVN